MQTVLPLSHFSLPFLSIPCAPSQLPNVWAVPAFLEVFSSPVHSQIAYVNELCFPHPCGGAKRSTWLSRDTYASGGELCGRLGGGVPGVYG